MCQFARFFLMSRSPSATSLSLVGGARHVLDGDTSFGTRAFHLGKVQAQLLGLLLSGLRGVRLLASPTPRRLLGLIGRLPILSLACVLSALVTLKTRPCLRRPARRRAGRHHALAVGEST